MTLAVSAQAKHPDPGLTCGTTPTPSPMNVGATVTTTESTSGVPSVLGGACKNDERIIDPPSIMTDLSPRRVRMLGKSFALILPDGPSAQTAAGSHGTNRPTPEAPAQPWHRRPRRRVPALGRHPCRRSQSTAAGPLYRVGLCEYSIRRVSAQTAGIEVVGRG